MALFRFFKVPRHQQFEYKPRYWDPEKEELDARLRRHRNKPGGEKEAMKIRISSGFRARYSPEMHSRSRAIRKSNTIRLAIFIVLLLLSIILLSEKIANFVQLFEGSGS